MTGVAAGSTTVAEARRLNAVGVPAGRRYAGTGAVTTADRWVPGRIGDMVNNPLYAGGHVLKNRYGPVERPVPALVSLALRERAHAQLGGTGAWRRATPSTAISSAA